MSTGLLILMFLGWGAASLAHAADAPAVDQGAIKRLVKQLGDDDFQVRESAERELKKIGEPALAPLREAAAGKDLEAASRARRLIGVIRWDRIRGRFAEFAKGTDEQAEAKFEAMVFEVARLENADLDDGPARKKLEEYAGRVRTILGDRKGADDVAFALRHVLEIQEKFTGKTIDDDEYNKPEHSFLNRVIEKKQGLPIALATLYMLVGRRAKLPVVGVGAPGHFLCKVTDRDPAKEVFIDAYRNRTFTRAEFDTIFGAGADEAQREAVLAATSAKPVLRRLVQNLIAAYMKTGDLAKLEQVQQLAETLDSAIPAAKQN